MERTEGCIYLEMEPEGLLLLDGSCPSRGDVEEFERDESEDVLLP